MLGLVDTIDKPISVKVVPSRSYLMYIAGNLYDGVSHGWHFQFRHSFHALERKRRRKTDLISIKMLWGHVWIVYRHSEKNSLRKNILGFGPFDHCLQSGKCSVQFEGIRNPNIGDLPFGNVDQSHWKRGSLFFRAHGETIFVFREEFFANLAFFDSRRFFETDFAKYRSRIGRHAKKEALLKSLTLTLYRSNFGRNNEEDEQPFQD